MSKTSETVKKPYSDPVYFHTFTSESGKLGMRISRLDMSKAWKIGSNAERSVLICTATDTRIDQLCAEDYAAFQKTPAFTNGKHKGGYVKSKRLTILTNKVVEWRGNLFLSYPKTRTKTDVIIGRNDYEDTVREWQAFQTSCMVGQPVRGKKYQELILPYYEPAYKKSRELSGFVWLRSVIYADCLPKPEHNWDERKDIGGGVYRDLYGVDFTAGLCLMQIRFTFRQKKTHFLSIKKKYFVTDGIRAVEVPYYGIHKAARDYRTASAPLQAVAKHLPAEWAERLKPLDKADKVTTPPFDSEGEENCTVYKIVAVRGNRIESVYDSSPYVPGEWRQEEAQPGHTGGLFAYLSEIEARQAARAGLVFSRAWAEGKTLVLCRCTAGGKRVVYHGGKIAFSRLRIEQMIGPVFWVK